MTKTYQHSLAPADWREFTSALVMFPELEVVQTLDPSFRHVTEHGTEWFTTDVWTSADRFQALSDGTTDGPPRWWHSVYLSVMDRSESPNFQVVARYPTLFDYVADMCDTIANAGETYFQVLRRIGLDI